MASRRLVTRNAFSFPCTHLRVKTFKQSHSDQVNYIPGKKKVALNLIYGLILEMCDIWSYI